MQGTVEKATVDDARVVGRTLRSDDRRELLALGWHDHETLLVRGVEESTVSRTIWVGGAPVALFGVRRIDDQPVNTGAPWLLATTGIYQLDKRQFASESRRYVDWLNAFHPYLTNIVHAENATAIRWLQWCGFNFTNDLPGIGMQGEDFIQFERRRNV